MLRRITLAAISSAVLLLSTAAHADPVTVVYYCTLNDGVTKDDVMEINSRWLKWARETGDSDEITSSFVQAIVGDFEGFMWVDTYPNITTWGMIMDADSDFDDEFNAVTSCSSNRMLRAEETVPAK